jgi:uncharacterized protein
MTISMYKACVPIFVQYLTCPSSLLDKLDAHAEAKRIGTSVFLNIRLYSDKLHFARQVDEAYWQAANACTRLAGVELLTFPSTAPSLAELKECIVKTIDYFKGFKPARIDGTEERTIVIMSPDGDARGVL